MTALVQEIKERPVSVEPYFHQFFREGKTGFPSVDAGIRELNETGHMHNRVRMTVASFLTKDLHIDWRWSGMYFASKLIDYDPSVNIGNWQWTASTGCDAQSGFVYSILGCSNKNLML